jgi:superfamily II DNA or RNA helicase
VRELAHLRHVAWHLQYSSDDEDLVGSFYVPALRCALSYDRATGFFDANALRVAAQGIEELVRNDGRMRLIVGCTLQPDEIDAIQQGLDLRAAIAQHYADAPLSALDTSTHDALELLAWMIANSRLDVKVAVPCNAQRHPIPASGLFHDKSGVICDSYGDRIAFNGSVNETLAGWTRNWETYDVFTSWQDGPRVDIESEKFAKLWTDKARRVITVDVPDAVRDDLLRFLPTNDQPARLAAKVKSLPTPLPPVDLPPIQPSDGAPLVARDEAQFARVWAFINNAARREFDGMWVGPATSAVEPWPHQLRAYERMWNQWPPRLLIADEVGLGKTVQAGLLMRQALLSGRAKRILVMAPAGVLTQWQIELREKFNLHWPIYDGRALQWPRSPAWQGRTVEPVSRKEWLNQPFVLVSSHLVRRQERAKDLLEAEPWDLIVLDEAHHARRRGAGAAGGSGDKGPNALLALMQQLVAKSAGLVMLTATPMQVHPIEVWDLLNLLGLPPEWTAQEFLSYYDRLAEAPTPENLDRLAHLFQGLERQFGAAEPSLVARAAGVSGFKAKKLLSALRDPASLPRRQMSAEERQLAYRFLRTQTPVRRLVSRHTRELLRRYYKAGKLSTRVADRRVRDDFITMSPAERAVYESVENYISTTYNAASADQRNAVGFVMTIYRRRLSSSFAALGATLERRLSGMNNPLLGVAVTADDLDDDELEEGRDEEAAAVAMSAQALRQEEAGSIRHLLGMVKILPPDTKLGRLIGVLERLQEAGHRQVMVFSQYGDTMNFLREALAQEGARTGWRVMSYSGEGGGVRDAGGSWSTISRDEAKRQFRAGKADILVCTDAAAEGLNFQFCGALVNYDMPWNPMRVEQRIGRIDRLGQKFEQIQILNLHYSDTVETDVYKVLKERIGLFTNVVGKLQPILAQLPRAIRGAVLTGSEQGEGGRRGLTARIQDEIERAQQEKFDLDADAVIEFEEPSKHSSPVTLHDLGRVLANPGLLPIDVSAKSLGGYGEMSYQTPGIHELMRVSTEQGFYTEHPDSVELWSPGGPVFPDVVTEVELPSVQKLSELLDG